ncbi:MAG: NFACT RNA binding domain-containing protein [Bacteroidota bacterium]
MHYHYYLLEQLASELPTGEKIQACFSQDRNELIIEFDSFFLRIGCHTPLTYIVPVHRFSRARKNVVNLFEGLIGCNVLSYKVIPYDRILILNLEDDYQWVVKLHGQRANVILYKAGQWVESFNQNQEEAQHLTLKPGPFIDQVLPPSCEPQEILPLIRAISPIYEKQFAAKIHAHRESGISLPEAFDRVVREAQEVPYFIAKNTQGLKFLLFSPAQPDQVLSFPTASEALQQFLRLHFQYSTYKRQYKGLAKRVGDPYKKQKKVYSSFVKSIENLQKERSSEELGHILMANLHHIKLGDKLAVLDDFYHEGKVKIKLDPKLTPQDNAQRYYLKHKERKNRLAYLEAELAKIEGNFAKAEEEWKRFGQLPSPETLELNTQGIDREAQLALKQFAKEGPAVPQAKSVPFRRFECMNYEIFVGKNGKNNDELSFKFAAKEDIWLHAKDVAGSHVVIRQKAGRDLPRPVLEFAASLAAYFSKSKNDTVVPVIYTPRKFIRKRKGDAPGKVVVNRESVVLVEPLRKEEVIA